MPTKEDRYKAVMEVFRFYQSDAGDSDLTDPDGHLSLSLEKFLLEMAAKYGIPASELRSELTDIALNDRDTQRAEDDLKYGR